MNDEFNVKRIIFNKFKIIKHISSGSFGKVYLGKNILNDKFVAIKIEDKTTLMRKTLQKEAYFLYYLKGYGIPEIISYGCKGKYNILVETLLGKSLYDIQLKNKFTLKDICLIGIQAIDRLNYIHSKYVIHCDIKPQNFMVGNSNPSIIYICDFGISQKYRSSKTGKHVEFLKHERVYVSLKFSSINSILGFQKSRRDDLESLGYTLIYLINGLPWENLKYKNLEECINKICNYKKNISVKELCKGLPNEIECYFNYVRNLKFEEKPNYSYLKNLFFKILSKIQKIYDNVFSWNKKIILFRNSPYLKSSKTLPCLGNITLRETIEKSERKRNREIKSNNLPYVDEKNLKNGSRVIDYWINLIKKNKKFIPRYDNDLEVENNFFIGPKKIA